MNHLHNRDTTTSGPTQGSPACAAPNGPVVVHTPHGNPLRHPIPHGRATVASWVPTESRCDFRDFRHVTVIGFGKPIPMGLHMGIVSVDAKIEISAESLDLSKGANFEGHYPQPFLTLTRFQRRIFDRVKGEPQQKAMLVITTGLSALKAKVSLVKTLAVMLPFP
uniref:Uncharacterized protein n=1 Tax=Ananas comosus var. bracteatus TaxID=296719 RepID=A0A6V7PQF1_ANACO|nr:unnamed protein product [Ananas comosus var. bracteatus]